MGKLYTTVFCTFLQASTRVAVVCLLAPRLGLPGVAIACAAGWSLMLLYEVPYYFVTCRRLKIR